jgi:hypothetical protein
MKKILIGLCLLASMVFAKEGYVDVNVLLIKKHPSDESVKFGYYKKYTPISIIDIFEGIDNDDKWYKTDRGYVRAKYVVLYEDLPQLLTPDQVDTSKNAIQLAVYPKRAKNSLQDAIKKLIGEENVFVEMTSKANVLYIVNFPSYRDAVNKLDDVPFRGFVTRMKLKNNYVTTEPKVQTPKKVIVKKAPVKKALQEVVQESEKETVTPEVKPRKVVRKMLEDQVPESVMMDDDAEIDAIMKQIDNESYKNKSTKVVKQEVKKPEVKKDAPKVAKKEKIVPKKETFIALKNTKVKQRDDFNMDKELAKTLENALLALDKL